MGRGRSRNGLSPGFLLSFSINVGAVAAQHEVRLSRGTNNSFMVKIIGVERG
jgi:hypothetical protein